MKAPAAASTVAASTSRQQRRVAEFRENSEKQPARETDFPAEKDLLATSSASAHLFTDVGHVDGEYLGEHVLGAAALASMMTAIVSVMSENSGSRMYSESSRSAVDLFVLIAARGEVMKQLSGSARLGTHRAE